MRLNIRRNGLDAADYDESAFVENGATVGDVWSRAVPLGRGSVVSAPLNWTAPLDEQFAVPLCADAVIGADVVWLAELREPFCRTMHALLAQTKGAHGLLAYRERGGEQSTTFSTGAQLVDSLCDRGCTANVVHSAVAHKSPQRRVLVFDVAIGE